MPSPTTGGVRSGGQGLHGPNENYFNNGAGTTPARPTSRAGDLELQAGTTWQTRQLSVSGDVYYIHFGNEILSEKFGPDTIYYNAGARTTRCGVERDYYLGMGLSLYANGSVNRAKVIENAQTNCATGNCTGGLWVPTPERHPGLRMIYNEYGIYASPAQQARRPHLRRTWAKHSPSAPTVSSTAHWLHLRRQCRLVQGCLGQLQLSNLLNKTPVIALAGYTAWLGTPLYWTLPERSFNVTLEVPL